MGFPRQFNGVYYRLGHFIGNSKSIKRVIKDKETKK